MAKQLQTRFNLAVSPKVAERLERLQARSDAASVAEVVRRGLAVYEELLAIESEGGKIVVESPSGERERLRIVH